MGVKIIGNSEMEEKEDIHSDKEIDYNNFFQQERLIRYKQDTTQRRGLAWWMVAIDTLWVIFIIVILLLCGTKVLFLDSSVLRAFLAATTANIIGMAYIVLKGLFERRH